MEARQGREIWPEGWRTGTSATGGQARDGLSAGLPALAIRPEPQPLEAIWNRGNGTITHILLFRLSFVRNQKKNHDAQTIGHS